MAVNEVKVKNDKKKETVEEPKEIVNKFYKEFGKSRIPLNEDNANKKEIESAALKFVDDPANAGMKVTDHEEIAKILSAKNKKVCWSCWFINCYKKQVGSMQLKMKKRYLGKCTGVPTTFKDLKAR